MGAPPELLEGELLGPGSFMALALKCSAPSTSPYSIQDSTTGVKAQFSTTEGQGSQISKFPKNRDLSFLDYVKIGTSHFGGAWPPCPCIRVCPSISTLRTNRGKGSSWIEPRVGRKKRAVLTQVFT